MSNQKYNNPPTVESSVGTQIRVDSFWRKSLIEAAKDQYFQQTASVKDMPKHSGKKIKRYKFLPILNDGNINSQGLNPDGSSTSNDGNLYASSKDVGSITSKLPVLREEGGQVNRVGFTRQELEGSFETYGFYFSYTKDSMDMDSDAELYSHMSDESIKTGSQLTEAALQADLLSNAGLVKYTGAASAMNELDPFATVPCVLTYDDIIKLGIDLTNNRTPKQNTIITGSTMVDTKVVEGKFTAYCGSDLEVSLRKLTDYHGAPAFIPTSQYGAAESIMRGEIGSVGQFRIIQPEEMQHHEGGGAVLAGGDDGTFLDDGANYNAYPFLVIGQEAFTTIGFNAGTNGMKFDIKSKMPGQATADLADPYGLNGFMSIRFNYGFMPLRDERLAVLWTCAAA